MNVLGLHFGHDGSAAVVRDGKLLAALALERLWGAKKAHGVSGELIDAVCASAGISAGEVDLVALSDYHPRYDHGAVEVREQHSPNPAPDAWNRVFANEVLLYDVVLRGRVVPGFHPSHHLAHCAAAFYTSGYPDAWCVSMDASGGELASNFVVARGSGLRLEAVPAPYCLAGVAYDEATAKIGLGTGMHKAGSLMALAAYGTRTKDAAALAAGAFFPEGSGLAYRGWTEDLWNAVAGRPPFDWCRWDFEAGKDIAADVQAFFEAAVLRAVEALPADGCGNLCLAGGSFLNCCANSRVLRESRFRNVHLFPAATDDGLSVGAALYVAHHLFGAPRPAYRAGEIAYLGKPQWSEPIDVERVARKIAGGGVVAWVNGRSEYGPRALGNRSLLADPRNAGVRERINAANLKDREWFRPVCPSVLAEESAEWFDLPAPSPFMLFTAGVRRPDEVPGVVHVDGTARHQDVREEDNPDFYALLRAFRDLTGVPVLVNTSLNGPGEPIVESRRDAAAFWNSRAVDMLVSHGYVWER